MNIKKPDAEFAKNMYESLGFEYSCIDLMEAENCYALDLNFDQVPMEIYNKFDLVTNLGTTEHLINQNNCFKFLHDLTKLNGFMFHNVPFQGFENHSLICYNPKLFWMIARSNNYKLHFFHVTRSKKKHLINNDIINNIMDNFDNGLPNELKEFYLEDASIQIVFEKIHESQYVPPIDVYSGTKTNFKYLSDVYKIFKFEK